MATLLNRSLSLVLLIAYAIVAHHLGVLPLMLKLGFPLLLATVCIWFPDAFGQFTGVMHYHPITTTSAGFIICLAGWLVLILLPLSVWYVVVATLKT